MDITLPAIPAGVLVLLGLIAPHLIGFLNGILSFIEKPWQKRTLSVVVPVVLAALVLAFTSSTPATPCPSGPSSCRSPLWSSRPATRSSRNPRPPPSSAGRRSAPRFAATVADQGPPNRSALFGERDFTVDDQLDSSLDSRLDNIGAD
ncbi:hypothetical protein K8F61_09855 [Microbacterium resistens]|uniref:Uncharacterized protein n=1 Tax=Microbacterium resistens TaxID=156977 RepID=A0ABY3RQ09_9MICO|nr:hypothetical protein [Microbacterium resistens]UGS25013.1 hypothetical protein K8F61_09855 [Microbacterium resistens]